MHAFRIAVKPPGAAVLGDALPDRTFGCRSQLWPMLHLAKTTAAAFAKVVSLAGGTNRNAGRIWGAFVPNQPGCISLARHAALVSLVLVVKNQQCIHLGQGPQLWCQGNAIGRRRTLAPVVNGRFDVGNMDAHAACAAGCRRGIYAGWRMSGYRGHGERMIPRPNPCTPL